MNIGMIIESVACNQLAKDVPSKLLEQINADITNNTTYVIEATAFDILNEAESAEKSAGWFKTFIAFCARIIDSVVQNIKALFTPYSTYVKKNSSAIKAGWSKIQDMEFKYVPADYLLGHIEAEENIADIVKFETGFVIYSDLDRSEITKQYGSIVALKDRVMATMKKEYLTSEGVSYKDKNSIDTTVAKSGIGAEDIIAFNGTYFDRHIKTLRELIQRSRMYNESYVKYSSRKSISGAVEKFNIIKMAYNLIASVSSNGIYIMNISINQFSKLAKAAVAAA